MSGPQGISWLYFASVNIAFVPQSRCRWNKALSESALLSARLAHLAVLQPPEAQPTSLIAHAWLLLNGRMVMLTKCAPYSQIIQRIPSKTLCWGIHPYSWILDVILTKSPCLNHVLWHICVMCKWFADTILLAGQTAETPSASRKCVKAVVQCSFPNPTILSAAECGLWWGPPAPAVSPHPEAEQLLCSPVEYTTDCLRNTNP